MGRTTFRGRSDGRGKEREKTTGLFGGTEGRLRLDGGTGVRPGREIGLTTPLGLGQEGVGADAEEEVFSCCN